MSRRQGFDNLKGLRHNKRNLSGAFEPLANLH